jgi:hypothetical protein
MKRKISKDLSKNQYLINQSKICVSQKNNIQSSEDKKKGRTVREILKTFKKRFILTKVIGNKNLNTKGVKKARSEKRIKQIIFQNQKRLTIRQ